MPNKNNLLIITSALPYANGPLHFGHLLEHIQTDIWVRTNRALNKECIYICASDAHGTPIMLKAEEENIQPEKLIEEITEIQKKSLINFNIKHDNYYTTHSEENKDLVEVADALTDILYVTYGAGHAFGINLDKCFNEVQNSNMSKLGLNGKPIYNEFGKVMKGPKYFKPNLSKFIKT